MTARTGVIAGSSGAIPDDMLLDKYRVTDIEFDENEYNNFARRTLADFRPDAPFLESDQPRDPSDRGSGNLSAMKISLRENGFRSEATPWLDEGQFLDHHALERDPRGASNMPDFNEYKRQSQARGPYIKFFKDDDFSVPESGINPKEMTRLRRSNQHDLAKRLIIFDESKDAWHNGGIKRGGLTSRVVFQTNSGVILNLADATAANRRDLVDRASNSLPSILRSSGPDHRIKIASYSNIRPMIHIADTDYTANRTNAENDHVRHKQIEGDMKNKFMALLIADLEGQRENKQLVAQGAVYSDSDAQQNRQVNQKLNPEDIYKLTQISGPLPENATFADASIRSSMTNPDLRVALSSTKTNHEMAESINNAIRNRTELQTDDLREKIIRSADDYGVYFEKSNRRREEKTDPTQNRHSLDVRHIEDSKSIKNFSNIKPMIYHPTIKRTNFETLNNDSWKNKVRERKKTAKHIQKTDVEHTTNIFHFNDAPTKHVKGASRDTRKHIITNDIINKQSKNNTAPDRTRDIKQKILDSF
jgi:hypothetical protein